METGETFVIFNIGDDTFNRKMFVSRADDVAVINITGSIPHENILWLEPQNNSDSASEQHVPSLLKSLKREIEINGNDARYYYSASFDGCEFGVAMRVICDGSITKDYGYKAKAETLRTNGKNITILIKTFANQNAGEALANLGGELDAFFADANLYEKLLLRHTALHTPLYDSVKLRLHDDSFNDDTQNEILTDAAYDAKAPNLLLERLWKFGRYLFISGTSENSNPFPLYGLWHGTYNLPWCAHVANENVQMIYWHACAGGLGYAYKALIKYYASEMDSYKKNAENIFGCRGIFVPVYSSPGNSQPCVPVAVITNYIGAAGWLACMFHDYYLYTNDNELLKSDILPFMQETAMFYEDYLQYGENGKCVIYPSVSPENTPANLMPGDFTEFMGHPCPSVKNATMDFAILKDLLTRLVSCGAPDKIDAWQNILSKIPGYMINSDGAIKEWMAPELEDNYNHRHLSHIYPVFPGNEINRFDNGELFDAFKKAVDLRLLKGQSGWSLTHMACIWARLGEAGKAMECFDTLAKGCLGDNLFTTHNDYRHMGMSLDLGGTFAPVQLDANMGAVNAVFEMLLRRSGDVLFILPALDERRIKKGEAENMRFIGGEADIEWDGKYLSFTVRAARDLKLTVVLPEIYGGAKIEIELKQGKKYTYKN
jgi:alpha-L-fucosidase 2